MVDNPLLKSKSIFISIMLHLIAWILLSIVMLVKTNPPVINDQTQEHKQSEKKTLEVVQVTLASGKPKTESSTESEQVNTQSISNKTNGRPINKINKVDRVEQLENTSVNKQVYKSINNNSKPRQNTQVNLNRKDTVENKTVNVNNKNTEKLNVDNTVIVQKNNNSQPPNTKSSTKKTTGSANSKQTGSSQANSNSNKNTAKTTGTSAKPSPSSSNAQGKKNRSSSASNSTASSKNTNTNAVWSNYKQAVFKAINRQQTYPKQAELRQIQGIVVVKFTVTKQGKVNSAVITKKSNSELLNKNAKNLFKRLTIPKPPPDVINLLPKQLSIPLEYKLD